MLPTYQNSYGEHENRKGSKNSVSALKRFLHGALQLFNDSSCLLHWMFTASYMIALFNADPYINFVECSLQNDRFIKCSQGQRNISKTGRGTL